MSAYTSPNVRSRPGRTTEAAHVDMGRSKTNSRPDSGPLTSTAWLPEAVVFHGKQQAAEWLAYVALQGRFAFVNDGRRWYRWTGRRWRQTDLAEARTAFRRALFALYDQMVEQGRYADERMDLLNVNRAFRLAEAMRGVVSVSADRLGVQA